MSARSNQAGRLPTPEAIVAYPDDFELSREQQEFVDGVRRDLHEQAQRERLARVAIEMFRGGPEVEGRAGPATLPSSPAATGAIITVFGGHGGGIGRTTISTNLAVALSQRAGRSVALADLDTRFGDVAIVMDIPVERSISDLAMSEEEINRETLQECLYTHTSGVTILPAPIRPDDWRSVDARSVEAAVTLLAETYDYVILDTPGTFNDIVVSALKLATVLLVVTTPDAASLKDTDQALDLLRSWNYPEDKVKLVVSAMHLDRGAHMGVKGAADVQPNELARILSKEVFWIIPYDREIHRETTWGVPLVASNPSAEAAKSLAQLARKFHN